MKTKHETMGSTWTFQSRMGLISTSIPSSSKPTRWNRLGVQTHTGASGKFLGYHVSPTPTSYLTATLEWLDKAIHPDLWGVGSTSVSSLNIGMYTPSKASGLWESKFLLYNPCRVGTSPLFLVCAHGAEANQGRETRSRIQQTPSGKATSIGGGLPTFSLLLICPATNKEVTNDN